jgi:hypothetical protein
VRGAASRWFVLLLPILGCGRARFDEISDVKLDTTASGFRGLCGFARLTVIQNGLTVDDTVGAMLASSMASGCHTSPAVTTVSQGSPGILDPTTGRPLMAPDDLVVIGGGDGPNRAIAYLLAADTPVTWSGSSQATYKERATGRTLAMGPTSASHDYALVMVVSEPIGGTKILSASGMQVNGTRAAAYWFTTQIAPSLATDQDVWTLVEWSNADADPTPSAGDTFVVVASGR